MTATTPVDRELRDSVVIRFSGDSGDGMQLTGTQFTMETALSGSDLATFPDYPAEIRAPAGTTFGVSSFQIHFGSQDILTAGDMLDVLVAMNPAALVTNIKDLAVGGLIVLDTGAFNARNLEKAGYAENPIGNRGACAVSRTSPRYHPAHPGRGEGPRRVLQGSPALPQHVGARADALDVRP
jgi:2-oxoglutarate ferredoxin oxidoreductase subunit alpha